MTCSSCDELGEPCGLCMSADALAHVICAELDVPEVTAAPAFVLADVARALFAERADVQAFIGARSEGRSPETRLRAEEVAWERDENGWATDSIQLAYRVLRRLGVES